MRAGTPAVVVAAAIAGRGLRRSRTPLAGKRSASRRSTRPPLRRCSRLPGMKVDGGLFGTLADAGAQAAALEAAGYAGAWTAETSHDPFLPLLQAAEHTEQLELGTSIAVAFARSPMTLANTAIDVPSSMVSVCSAASSSGRNGSWLVSAVHAPEYPACSSSTACAAALSNWLGIPPSTFIARR